MEKTKVVINLTFSSPKKAKVPASAERFRITSPVWDSVLGRVFGSLQPRVSLFRARRSEDDYSPNT
jgi:hypothetical protein